nr:MAG TPA: hypothetical protein [Bacteriophage sp.]
MYINYSTPWKFFFDQFDFFFVCCFFYIIFSYYI